MSEQKFKPCCAKFMIKLFDNWGIKHIVLYETKCPACSQFISIRNGTRQEAYQLLNEIEQHD